MIDLDLDVRQYDCPFIDTTDEVDVTFSAVQWHLDTDRQQLETRLLVSGEDRSQLEAGLRVLEDHRNMADLTTFTKHDGVATIKTVIAETNAMRTIREHDGFITGPFRIEGGSEQWHVGFDDGATADRALSDLDRHNDIVVEQRTDLTAPALFDLVENAGAAKGLLDGCRSLTQTERRTLEAAATAGYFENPRDASLADLAEEFDVSKTAVSMNLRRAEKKLVGATVDSLASLTER